MVVVSCPGDPFRSVVRLLWLFDWVALTAASLVVVVLVCCSICYCCAGVRHVLLALLFVVVVGLSPANSTHPGRPMGRNETAPADEER